MFMTLEQKSQAIPKLMAQISQVDSKKRLKISNKIATYLADGATVYANQHTGGYGLLADAIFYDVSALADYCLEHDIDLETKGAYSKSPLITALEIWYTRGDYAERLLDKGVDVTQKNFDGQTILMLALKKGKVDLAQKLIDKGLSLRDVTDKGYTCLHAAIESGDVACVNFVLAANLPLDTKCNGNPYAVYAIQASNLDILKVLLVKGMQLDFGTAYGSHKQRLLDYAAIYRHRGNGSLVIEFLKAYQESSLRKAQEIQEQAARAARTGWRLINPDTVAHIDEQVAIGYCVTEIFNFRAGLYTRIHQNIETKAESSAILDFSQISQPQLVLEATEQLRRLGGAPVTAAPIKTLKTRKAS